ncbi:MAG: SUMF1/EgtB/PvdO family nonheme iron enzyme [Acidobacteriales bacterium]|nr:SUMF1/EgtB/PvdO family nonheme iron enzyme [Terriglobales bacterium]
MGSNAGQDNERPVHRVWVDAFALGRYQVTNREFAEYLQQTQATAPPFFHDPCFNGPTQPVVAASWFEAVAYAEWLSAITGKHFRLPTEAEWERAARGGVEGKLYPWGDAPPHSRANYSLRWQAGPEPVGTSEPNPFGIYDLCENVHEWCSDWFNPEYYAMSPERNPPGAERSERKSSRGGSWRHHVKVSRCAARSSIPPHFQYADYGFRLAGEI